MMMYIYAPRMCALLLQVWMTAGCLPLVAKVADFGLALPLGPTDTHATLHARVRPITISTSALLQYVISLDYHLTTGLLLSAPLLFTIQQV